MNRQKSLACHHSLVTPIDWKRRFYCLDFDRCPCSRHHSLVTPIDWKLKLVNMPSICNLTSRSPLAGDTY